MESESTKTVLSCFRSKFLGGDGVIWQVISLTFPPHSVDRLPLVASAILNVAQDVDEPWPTEIYDHQGRAHNVTYVDSSFVFPLKI
jgi:hypothetical protein